MRYRRTIPFPVLFIYLYQSPPFPIPWEDMFMDAGDFHLDVRYEGVMWIENIREHSGGQNMASIHEKCTQSDLILKFAFILFSNYTRHINGYQWIHLIITILTTLYGRIPRLNKHIYLTGNILKHFIAKWSNANKIKTNECAAIMANLLWKQWNSLWRKHFFVDCANIWEWWTTCSLMHFKLALAVLLVVCSALEPKLTSRTKAPIACPGSIFSFFPNIQGIPEKWQETITVTNIRFPYVFNGA